MSDTVHLGFEIGTGAAVSIPIGHMVVCGQTQRSGKTTALDALISRSGRQAIAFVTKRGEGALSGARTVPPYFRERADWQFVSSVIESVMKEKMKFERAWIMRACHGAKTLEGVRINVRKLQEKTKGGMNADMYMMLGEYLDTVVPLIAKLPTTSKVQLEPGRLSVMNLIAYPVQLQALVIRSTIEWIHEHEEKTIIMVPEAWKFMPRDRGGPVKMAAATVAREGATLGNLLWIDSQDITGADYEVLRQASVWLLGVQREANEIKRTLAHLPADVKKPKPTDIARLKLGQFWACTPDGAQLVYAQPKWLNELVARQIALGHVGVEVAIKGRTMAVDRLRETTEEHGATVWTDDQPLNEDDEPPEEDEMKPEEMKQLADMIGEAVGERVDGIRSHVDKLLDEQAARDKRKDLREMDAKHPALQPTSREQAHAGAPLDMEAIWREIRARLMKEAPTLVKLMTTKSEINVEVTLQEVTMDGATLRGRIAALLARGFFDKVKGGSELLAELKRLGGGTGDRANYSRELGWLTEKGFLTVEDGGWQAVDGMKVNIKRK